MITERHLPAKVGEGLAVERIGIASPVVVEIAVEAQPNPVALQLHGHVECVVVHLLEASEHEPFPVFHDTRPRTRHIDVAQSGHIAVFQTAHAQFHRGRRLGAYDTLRERVAGPHQL